MFVFSPDGRIFDLAGTPWADWPRYNTNTNTGERGDADANGQGHHGYGAYGLNTGIGNIDGDPALELLVTYDNHHIQAFDPDGQAVLASDDFTNRASR